jgi:ABC-type bacteriocin/lantibiotic exporter with double-glycine peptidase domain
MAGLSCGPAALVSAVDVIDPQASQSLRETLARDPRAAGLTTSFRDLADWATAAGQYPMAGHLSAPLCNQLATPFIAHLRPNHFVAVMACEKERILIQDRAASRWLTRKEFEEWFSGEVLCLLKNCCR